jgi:hypothetical protein
MKKFAVAIAILSISVFASCGGGGSPEAVAIDFTEALMTGEVEKAKELSTENSHKIVGLLAGMLSGAMANQTEDKKAEMEEKLKELETMACDVEGEKAKCGPEGEEKKLELVKVDGEWKVDFKKPAPGQQ